MSGDLDDVPEQAFYMKGYFGVLANHAAPITALNAGSLKARLAGGAEEKWQVSGGFFEVSNNKATVLADDVK